MGHFRLFSFGKSSGDTAKPVLPAIVDLLATSSIAQKPKPQDNGLAELSELKAMSLEARAVIMAANNKVWNLAFKGHATEVLALLADLSPEQQVKILAEGNNFEAMMKQGTAEAVYSLLKTYTPAQQGKLLAKPYIIANYLSGTPERVAEVLAIIRGMQPEDQTRVLANNHVVSSISRKGYALEVFDIIAHLDIDQKARVRVAKGYDEVMSFCSRRSADRQPKHGVTPPMGMQGQAPVNAA